MSVRRDSSIIVSLLVATIGLGCEDGQQTRSAEACEVLQEHLAACDLAIALPQDGCEVERVDALVSSSCEDITADLSAGKADYGSVEARDEQCKECIWLGICRDESECAYL